MSIGVVIICVGLLLFGAHVLAILFDKTGVPDVLLLLFVGLAIGPIFGLLDASAFGKIGPVFTTIALVAILFESGLGLDLDALTHSMLPALKLTVVNFFATVAVVVPAGLLLLDLSVAESILTGAIVAGTSSAVVIPLVTKLGLTPKTGTTLLLESSVSDVLCIVVTLALIEGMTADSVDVAPLVGQSIASFLVPIVVGAAAAVLWSVALRQVRRLENSISLTLAAVFVVYGASDAMGHSGAIAALSFGVLLGNIPALNGALERWGRKLDPVVLNRTERDFFAEVAFLIKTLFFVYVGVVMPLDDTGALLLGLGITALIFAIRVPVVRLTVRDPSVTRRDAAVSAAMVPKGLAAAVLASLPVQAGLAGGETIQAVVFAIILFSIVLSALLCFVHGSGVPALPYGLFLRRYPVEASATPADYSDELTVVDPYALPGANTAAAPAAPAAEWAEPAWADGSAGTTDPGWVPDAPSVGSGADAMQPAPSHPETDAGAAASARRPSDATVPAELWPDSDREG